MSIQLPESVQPTTPVNTHDYDIECAECFLEHYHTYAGHFQNLLRGALGRQFGGDWTWTPDREREMHEWEMAWWQAETPFSWDEAYRQTYHWA